MLIKRNILLLVELAMTIVLVICVIIWNCCRMRINKAKVQIIREQLYGIKVSVEKLQESYIISERTKKAQSSFMNRMSHDLRTPLNAVMGYSSLMNQYAYDSDRVRHYSQRIYASGQILMELINDVLDMGCIESGNLKLIEREFSLNAAFDEVKTALKPQMDERQQKFHFYITNNTDKDLVFGDKQRFCQILRNVMSNAVKYTGAGGNIDLIVNIYETEGQELQLTYMVKDTGCGMSEEFIKRLFQPFQREEHELSTGIPGTGLGMCIVKSIVELMNGSISIESKIGAGTVVAVNLPLKPAIQEKCERNISLTAGDELSGMSFLVAEDNVFNAEILKEVLTAMGAECTLAMDGRAAVKLFQESNTGTYNAVLMDIQMPVMNGYQAAKAIRNSTHPEAGDIAIIAMTADVFEDDVQRAFAYGMNAHVAKPLNIKSFIGTIKTLGLN